MFLVNRDSTNLTTQTENLRTDFASIDPLTRPYVCAQCSQIINERYLLYTEDRLCRRTFWHIHCLRCQSCNVPLADLSIPVCYSKNNQIFCQIDYIKFDLFNKMLILFHFNFFYSFFQTLWQSTLLSLQSNHK